MLLLHQSHRVLRVVEEHLLIVVRVDRIVFIDQGSDLRVLLLLVEDILHALLDLVGGLLGQSFTVLLHEDAQLLGDLLLGGAAAAFVLAALALVRLLLESFGVAERVEGVVGRAHAGANTRQHDNFDFVVSEEGVTKNHGQFRLPEGHVLTLTALGLRLIESADALLQAQQRLVDLGALHLPVLDVALAVLGTL